MRPSHEMASRAGPNVRQDGKPLSRMARAAAVVAPIALAIGFLRLSYSRATPCVVAEIQAISNIGKAIAGSWGEVMHLVIAVGLLASVDAIGRH